MLTSQSYFINQYNRTDYTRNPYDFRNARIMQNAIIRLSTGLFYGR